MGGQKEREINVGIQKTPNTPKKKVMERATKGEPTYPPLNLPSVRQATSRERPAPMIKLVGFNISGIPRCGDRDDRRYHDQMGKSAKRRVREERRIKTKQQSELQRRKGPKAAL